MLPSHGEEPLSYQIGIPDMALQAMYFAGKAWYLICMQTTTESQFPSKLYTREPDWSPPVILESLRIPKGVVHVVREDLLPGGTKQRAILPYLRDLRARGVTEVVYASPFCGFAQVALAVCGAAMQMPVTLFCERDPGKVGANPVQHAFTTVAASFGARIHLYENLTAAHDAATDYANQDDRVFNVPLGFSDPSYIAHMTKEVRRQYGLIEARLGEKPRRLWLPVGSGTLARIFCGLVDPACQILCVDVGVLPSTDPRISGLREFPQVQLMKAEESFREKSRTLPPVPSNIHYDAKLWSWIRRHGEDGDVWWNVAR